MPRSNRVLFLPVILVLAGCLHVVTRSDVESLAATGPLNSSELASAICGQSVTYLAAPTDPAAGMAHAKLVSWAPSSDTEGTATALITGTAVRKKWPDELVVGQCQATIAFRYRFHWVDNGRAIVRESDFTEGRVVVKP